ncbi:RHS repeat-associated core domain-containing protein [Serratia liquefaciens]|uniref:RHS repeat-associated core domain-containing protein n=1 Tax=Serratia liquefaciens TaxID=614 RepID=UPI00345FA55C
MWLARYKAWGGVKPAPYGNVDPVGADNRIRFQGQYHDEETGLAYNRHRFNNRRWMLAIAKILTGKQAK